jgi:hypothetical protein
VRLAAEASLARSGAIDPVEPSPHGELQTIEHLWLAPHDRHRERLE